MNERLAKVEEWCEGHEERCADRQRSLGREIGDLKTSHKTMGDDFRGLTKGAWGVVIALLAWAAMQLWDNMKRPLMAPAPAPAATAPR